jgi:hypothetical protein
VIIFNKLFANNVRGSFDVVQRSTKETSSSGLTTAQQQAQPFLPWEYAQLSP